MLIIIPFLLGMFQSLQPASASDYFSPKTAALAGAGHAAPSLSDAIYLNPSAVSQTKTYNIYAGFDSYHGPDDREPKGRVYGLSLLDGRNEIFQAGIGYQQRADGTLINIGASKSFMDSLGVGLGTKYAYNAAHRASAKDINLSAVYRLNPQASVSVMIDNVISSGTAKTWGLYREYILGLKYSFENILSVYVDPHLISGLPSGSYGYEAGLELMPLTDFFVRIGRSKLSQQPQLGIYGRGLGWGLGWIGGKLSLDFAVYRSLEPVMATNSIFSGTIFY